MQALLVLVLGVDQVAASLAEFKRKTKHPSRVVAFD
jgi:hypothetical protein